jgi:hypothetical protein
MFTRYCILEYVELKLRQLDGFLAALKSCKIEHNGQSELLYTDFQTAIRSSVNPNKSN